MALNYAALQTELETDPVALGYKIGGAFRPDPELADLLNAVLPSIAIPRPAIPTWEVLAATEEADYDALTASLRALYHVLLSMGTLNPSATRTQAVFSKLFPVGSATRVNLSALASRPGSRAEQVLGAGVRLHHTDIAKALGRGD